MMIFDYESFLDNLEGNDLKIDNITIVWYIFGSIIYRVIDSVLQSMGIDILWAICAGYIAYYQYMVWDRSVMKKGS